jgi:hypothetical protein
MGELGKGAHQLEKISASIASVVNELSSTGAVSNRKDVHGLVSDTLQGRPLESIKMIRYKI